MGLLDFFKAKKAAGNSEKLRDLLFAAIQASNWSCLANLCDVHHDKIVREFSGWTTAPRAIRGDLAAMQRFGHCLGALADFFARVRGEPELLQQLIGPEESNPIVQWQKKLQQAEAWMEELRFEDVIALLAKLLNDVRPLRDFQGNFVATNLPKTYGHLGYSYFQTGRAGKSIEPLVQALDLCRQHGDTEGVVAYLGNLFEAHRYLGQAEPSADYAERLADALARQGQDTQVAWFQKQAAMLRAGEPRVRVIAEANGQRYELDEFAVPTGVYVSFVFYRNRISLRPGLRCLAQAEAFWGQGRPDEALSALLAASRADPFDPQPWYQMGSVMLYSRCYAEAAVSYKRAEELAPGWFHCRRYLWLARQLAEGRLDHDTFLTLQALDGGREDRTPDAKVALARDTLAKTPEVAWLYLCLGGYLKELQHSREAERAFRGGLDHADEPDVKSCLLLELALVLESASPERMRLLEEVRNLNGNLIATASAGVVLNHDVGMKR